MDDAQKAYFNSIVASLIFIIGVGAHALEMEYIDPVEAKKLEHVFAQASLKAKQHAQIEGGNWTCDMYGVRTRLQVQRGIKLYQFKKESEAWRNSGAQVVAQYTAKDDHLNGVNGRLIDQIKMTDDGSLISRLSLGGSEPRVLAYSVCKTL